MAIKVELTTFFKKNLTLMLKRGKKEKKFTDVLELLIENIEQGVEPHLLLPNKYKLHKMSGQYSGFWDCHIENDWILIYSLDQGVLRLVRTCSHSDFMHKTRK